MMEKTFFGRQRHILVRVIFQKSVREKYKITLDFNSFFENHYYIIIIWTALKASAQSVSAARSRGLYSVINKNMN